MTEHDALKLYVNRIQSAHDYLMETPYSRMALGAIFVRLGYTVDGIDTGGTNQDGWTFPPIELDPRIPALETRVKELEEHIEKHYTGAATGYIKELEGDVCRLEPENKRLREALEKIVTHVEENRGFDSVYKIAAHCGYYARAALEGKEPS